METPIAYRTVQIDGTSIFYREAGSKDAPTILLLHGLPSSSRMFQPLLDRRVRIPERARAGADSKRSVLRLPH
jgi:pimeloyl-ACP methyl ester carboxylesterase